MVGRTAVAATEQNPANSASESSATSKLLTPEFKGYVKDLMSEWNNPGVSLAVIDEEDVYAESYGYGSLPDTKATPNTLYFTGSTTKAFCAALLAHLINSKKYPELSKGWDTPISSILHDDFVLQDNWATKHLTLRDAAGHITGMSRHDLSLMRETNGKESTNRDFVRNLRHLPMPTEPRKQFQYCNYMYFVLSHVIETVTGQWLGDCLREHIFQPLGMNATFLDMKDAENAPEHVADSYLWSEDDKKYNKLPHMPARQLSGAGGLISTVKDYAKWAKALIYKSDLFNEATHADIRSSISIATASDELDILYGLGWMRRVVYDKVAYIHNGSTGTFGSYVIWFPHVKFGVVAFSNGFETAVPVTNILAWRLIADRLEVPAADRVDVNDKFKKNEQKAKDDLKKTTEILYPTRPDKPLPPTLPIKQLAGKYHHVAYGTHNLVETQNTTKDGGAVLVSERPDVVFASKMRLEHVSGDYWTARLSWLSTGTAVSFFAVEFKFGIDGKPSALEMNIESRDEGVFEGKVLFERMD